MPLYEYKCEECGYISKRLESIKSIKTKTDCDECGHVSERIISHSHLHFVVGDWQSKQDKLKYRKRKVEFD